MVVSINNTTLVSTTPEPLEALFNRDIETLFGLILFLLTIFGMLENGTVIVMFVKNHAELKARIVSFLISLAISDFIMSAVGGTMYSVSALSHTWKFGDNGCVAYAFIMFWTGCTDIAHLTLIALERVFAIGSPIKYRAWQTKSSLTIGSIIFAWCYGFLWAFLPLVGFQEYTYEGSVSCSINWTSTKPKDVAYNFVIFTMSFFIPLLVMTISNLFIFLTVRSSSKNFQGAADDSMAKKKSELERKLAFSLAIVMLVYLMAWTPYAVVSMIGAFGDASNIPPGARGFPAVLSKFSMILNPLIYIGTNKNYRNKIKLLFKKTSTISPANAAAQQAGNTAEIEPEASTSMTVVPTAVRRDNGKSKQ